MVDAIAVLFPTIVIVGAFVLGIFLYRAMVQQPLQDIETSSSQMSSLTQLSQGDSCLSVCQSLTVKDPDDIPMPTYPPRALRASSLIGDIGMGPIF
jgi:cation transporter-like permease